MKNLTVTETRPCPHCGGHMIGDGYTTVVHCEFAEDYMDVEPDADPIYCTPDPETYPI